MSKFMLNGKPYGVSTNYASSVVCTDAEGNESTVQAEIDKNRENIANMTDRGAVIASGRKTVASVYGTFTTVATITLPADSTYLLLGQLESSISNDATLVAGLIHVSGTASFFQYNGVCRGTMSNGGGISVHGVIKCTTETVVGIRGYGSVNTTHNIFGDIVGIRLQ